jgi:hypothetical protein
VVDSDPVDVQLQPCAGFNRASGTLALRTVNLNLEHHSCFRVQLNTGGNDFCKIIGDIFSLWKSKFELKLSASASLLTSVMASCYSVRTFDYSLA